MKNKIIFVIAFLGLLGILAGPNKDDPSSHPATKSSAATSDQAYAATSDQVSQFMDDVNSKVIRDAEREYQIASSSGSDVDRCVQAGMVAAAYLQAHDQPSYQSWKMREDMDCHR